MTEELIEETVCKVFEEEARFLYVRTRKRTVVVARQVCMTLIYRLLDLTSAQTGAIYDLDHSTVLYACKTVDNLYDTDKAFRYKFNTVKNSLKILSHVTGLIPTKIDLLQLTKNHTYYVETGEQIGNTVII